MNSIPLKIGKKIYEMDGGWENDDPEEYSIRANKVDYEERCAYYDKLRARKAWKKAKHVIFCISNSKVSS